MVLHIFFIMSKEARVTLDSWKRRVVNAYVRSGLVETTTRVLLEILYNHVKCMDL